MAAVVLQQHRNAQRGAAPPAGEHRLIFIEKGPELDQLVNVNPGRLHAAQSFRQGHNPLPTPPLGLVTAPLPAPRSKPASSKSSTLPTEPQMASTVRVPPPRIVIRITLPASAPPR